jgi:dUTP pyrophosphatase
MNNSFGVIDSDYRGEWMMILSSLKEDMTSNPLPYGVGDRVAQIYFEEVISVKFVETDELSNSTRGTGGFGSTGIK